MLTRAVTRGRAADRRGGHALRLVPGLRRGRTAQRDPLRQGRGGSAAEKLETGPSATSRRCARRRDVRSHGAHRPDAAVGDDAGRLPRAGPHRRGRRGGSSTRRSRSRPAASRSCWRRCLRRWRPGSRRPWSSRRSGSARAPSATARCSSSTTCSGSTRAARRASPSATRTSAAAFARARALRRRRALGRLPGRGAHVRHARGGTRAFLDGSPSGSTAAESRTER